MKYKHIYRNKWLDLTADEMFAGDNFIGYWHNIIISDGDPNKDDDRTDKNKEQDIRR